MIIVSLSLSQLLPQAFQVVEVEALVVVRALEFALELGIAQAVLEGDLRVVMDALIEVDVPLSSYGLLITNAKSFFLDFFQLRFPHIKREGDKIAHSLARHTYNYCF